jgi:hypothetical protein
MQYAERTNTCRATCVLTTVSDHDARNIGTNGEEELTIKLYSRLAKSF